MKIEPVLIVGAGLSGVECAFMLAKHAIPVHLLEMRPLVTTPAHTTDLFAELVCSNSFRATGMENAVGILKEHMRVLDSLVMRAADAHRIPAGKALAVDREQFSTYITNEIKKNPLITVEHKECISLEEYKKLFNYIILATGPLSSHSLTESLLNIIEEKDLYFYDAIAPIVVKDSIDMDNAFWASRYQKEDEEGEYINCPLTKEEYIIFYRELISGESIPTHNAEKALHFEGCMPIEALAERGEKTLLFGCLKPVGIIDSKTNKRPFAVLQLRLEDHNKTACNLVGFQTRLVYKEQDRIFRLIPALKNVEFIRYGSIHRNTYLNSPRVLTKELSLKKDESIYCIGQMIGVEGYLESAATGLWLGLYLANKIQGRVLSAPPETTPIGALLAHVQRPVKNFQPSNVTFGLMPDLHEFYKKRERRQLYAKRAEDDFIEWKDRCVL
ncbi:MAG: methylenetetrahydrofolate--tRNA-(uracil(54)-C(5))-methyltransferase (FADH(2)-oxidizing) TrmFO [Desulfovibrionaceae bacterium]